MQVKINIKPENEAMFIQALNDSNITYWIEEKQQIVTQDVSSDEIEAERRNRIEAPQVQYLAKYYFLAGCQHVRNQLSKEQPLNNPPHAATNNSRITDIPRSCQTEARELPGRQVPPELCLFR